MAEFRLCGLTELASREVICVALAVQGGCASGEITLGERRRDASGLDSVWARGPVAAAARLVKAGRVNILGLVTRVMPLAQRRLQCFRCLEFGHVQAKCSSPESRRLLCYRCGVEGHTARLCVAAPSCPLCTRAGLPGAHRMGGPACRPPAPPSRAAIKRGRLREAGGRVSGVEKINFTPFHPLGDEISKNPYVVGTSVIKTMYLPNCTYLPVVYY